MTLRITQGTIERKTMSGHESENDHDYSTIGPNCENNYECSVVIAKTITAVSVRS
jgi:hypothetical protein